MDDKYRILLICSLDSSVSKFLIDALSTLGLVTTIDTNGSSVPGFPCNFDIGIICVAGHIETLQLIAQMKQKCPVVPIVVFTPLEEWEKARDVMKAGAKDYKTLTLNPAEIRRIVKDAMIDSTIHRIERS